MEEECRSSHVHFRSYTAGYNDGEITRSDPCFTCSKGPKNSWSIALAVIVAATTFLTHGHEIMPIITPVLPWLLKPQHLWQDINGEEHIQAVMLLILQNMLDGMICKACRYHATKPSCANLKHFAKKSGCFGVPALDHRSPFGMPQNCQCQLKHAFSPSLVQIRWWIPMTLLHRSRASVG